MVLFYENSKLGELHKNNRRNPETEEARVNHALRRIIHKPISPGNYGIAILPRRQRIDI